MEILMMFFFEKMMYICNYMVLFFSKVGRAMPRLAGLIWIIWYVHAVSVPPFRISPIPNWEPDPMSMIDRFATS
jgi:hypothetical protein